MGRLLLDDLHERFGIDPAPGWETGSWKDRGSFPDDNQCPAGLGTPLAP
jgi:hypothetical protein